MPNRTLIACLAVAAALLPAPVQASVPVEVDLDALHAPLDPFHLLRGLQGASGEASSRGELEDLARLDALAVPAWDAWIDTVPGAPSLRLIHGGDILPLLPDGSLLLSSRTGTIELGEASQAAFVRGARALAAPPARTAAAPPAPSLVGDGPAAATTAAPLPASSPAPEDGPAASGIQAARTAEPPFTLAPATAIATGSAALTILALLGLALYHRIRPHATLENDTRKQIFDAVCTYPGLGVHAIARLADVSYSTATYHLERLVAAGMIVMTPDGNKLCYYKNGGAFTEAERKILPILKNEEAAKLFEAILDNPGTYRAALAERLGVTATTINWHLRRLREAGLVHETRAGRNAYLYPNAQTMQTSFVALLQKIGASDQAVAEKLRRYVGDAASGASASS